jgi:hypothetical protein
MPVQEGLQPQARPSGVDAARVVAARCLATS